MPLLNPMWSFGAMAFLAQSCYIDLRLAPLPTPCRGLSSQGSAGLIGLGKPLEYQLQIEVGQFTIGLPLQAGAAKAIELGRNQAFWPGLLLEWVVR